MSVNIDQLSLTAIPLEQYFNDTRLGHATGFIWRIGEYAHEKFFLVTNWHVLSGRDFFTHKNVSEHGGRPNVLRALVQVNGSWQKQRLDIPVRDENDEPLWLMHPAKPVDIAVLPLNSDQSKHFKSLPLNILANERLVIRIGAEVFILGYPFEIAPPAFPIWKRGSIASEPSLARLTTGYMHVDTASRPGMSGAPVIRRSVGTHVLEGNNVATDSGTRSKFIGVYSGRIPTTHSYEAQIGLVWDASFIDEIIIGNTLDN